MVSASYICLIDMYLIESDFAQTHYWANSVAHHLFSLTSISNANFS